MSRARVALFIAILPSRKGRDDPTGPHFPHKIFPFSCRPRAYSLVLVPKGEPLPMLYAILCYHDEDLVGSWTREQDAAAMTKLGVVQDKLKKQGRLWPAARLLPTPAAAGLRKDGSPGALGGPYAETQEQLLGFCVVDCESLDAALDVARDLGAANPGGAYEIRPVGLFQPGGQVTC